jgi:23S rRNA-/tRNA-specific pseudouridylate synthase
MRILRHKDIMNSENIEITVPEEYNQERIDKFLVFSLELDLSRSYIQKLIRNGSGSMKR